MRQFGLRIAASLLLISTALTTSALAQDNRHSRGGGPAPAGHAAAPTPHIAAPTPHFAAPTPHVAAAPRQQSTPTHFAAPRGPSPQGSRPQFARPNIARTNVGRSNTGRSGGATNFARHNGAATVAHHNGAAGQPQSRSRLSRHETPAASIRRQAHVNGPANVQRNLNRRGAPTTPSVIGQSLGNRNRNAANQNAANQAARSQIYAARRPVLHNQSFANLGARDPAMRNLARATFGGRFAQLRTHDQDRFRDRFHGRVIGWAGPIFWPYAYADFVDYTIWPYADDTFWPYAYDDVYDGLFGGYALDQSAYANAPVGTATRRSRRSNNNSSGGVNGGGSAEICSAQTSGLTDWPIERIAQQVQPDDAQRAALDQLKTATVQAVDILKSACPTDLPSTPTGRLGAMRQRIETMRQAVQVVRPALEKFYNSLSDEQKERFNVLQPEATASARGARSAERQQSDLTQNCGGEAVPVASLPVGQIEQALRPNDAQRPALQALDEASKKAAALLQANCPQDQALTPTGRVAAMEQRLDAMLQALDTVQPALAKFYNSLSDEQKARFDRLPRTA